MLTINIFLQKEYSLNTWWHEWNQLKSFVSQVKTLARELYEGYFKVAESHPRDVVAKLNSIVMQLEAACDLYNDPIKVTNQLHYKIVTSKG